MPYAPTIMGNESVVGETHDVILRGGWKIGTLVLESIDPRLWRGYWRGVCAGEDPDYNTVMWAVYDLWRAHAE